MSAATATATEATASSCKLVANPNTHCVCASCRSRNKVVAESTTAQARALEKKQAKREAKRSSLSKIGAAAIASMEDQRDQDRTSIQRAKAEAREEEKMEALFLAELARDDVVD